MATGSAPLRWRNRFHLLRHGQSRANEAGLIVSGHEGLDDRYGLTPLGEQQARQAAAALKRQLRDPTQALVICSDFARALQTAALVAQHLGCPHPVIHTGLRERFFGSLNLGPCQHYEDVWEKDEVDANHTAFGVESVRSVMQRMAAVVLELEKQLTDRDIVLVAHGDPLQILQTWFLTVDPRRHRHYPHLNTGEARQVTAVATESSAILTVAIAAAGPEAHSVHRLDLTTASSSEASGRQSPVTTTSRRPSPMARGDHPEAAEGPPEPAGEQVKDHEPAASPRREEEPVVQALSANFWLWCGAALAIATAALWLWRRRHA